MFESQWFYLRVYELTLGMILIFFWFKKEKINYTYILIPLILTLLVSLSFVLYNYSKVKEVYNSFFMFLSEVEGEILLVLSYPLLKGLIATVLCLFIVKKGRTVKEFD